MRKLWLVLLAALLVSSCTEDSSIPTPENSPASGTQVNLESSIEYSLGGGMLDRWDELEISVDGLATGWVIDANGAREPVGSRQLSSEEMDELARLMEPLSKYSRYYKPDSFMPDGLTSRITTEQDGSEITVTIYQPGEVELPPDLEDLVNILDQVLESLR